VISVSDGLPRRDLGDAPAVRFAPRHLRVVRRPPTDEGVVARLLGPADLQLVYALHRRTLALAPTVGLVKPETREFFARHFEEVGRILGVWHGRTLIAYAVVGLPVGPSYNFGVEIDLAGDRLLAVAQLDGVSVAPEWRGRGLHRSLCEWRIEIARVADRRHVLSTVAPTNHFSWCNLMAHDLRVRRLRYKFGGALRYILHRDLQRPVSIDTERSVVVPIGDTERQQELLGMGYLGYAPVEAPGGISVRYGPAISPRKDR